MLKKRPERAPSHNPVDSEYFKHASVRVMTPPLGRRIWHWFGELRWNREIRRDNVLERLETAINALDDLEGLIERKDQFAIRGLAMEIGWIGWWYNFRVGRFMDALWAAEKRLGTWHDECKRLADGPFNKQENFPLDDERLLRLVVEGKKPATLIEREFKGPAKRAGLLVYPMGRHFRFIFVSGKEPASKFYNSNFIVENFSILHPKIAESLERSFSLWKDIPLARCLYEIENTSRRSESTSSLSYHIFRGLFFGYPIRAVYRCALSELFYQGGYQFEKNAHYFGELETWHGLGFERKIR